MRLVYPYRRSRDGMSDELLRYSIRSATAVWDVSRVDVYGDSPGAWFAGYSVPLDKVSAMVFTDVAISLHHATGNYAPFLLMNDDFFMLSEWDPRLLHRGRLFLSAFVGPHRKAANNAIMIGAPCRTSPLDFSLHCPMPMRPETLRRVIADNGLRRKPALIRSVYGNAVADPADYCPQDRKAWTREDLERLLDAGHEWISVSTGRDVCELVLREMRTRHPRPSRFERAKAA